MWFSAQVDSPRALCAGAQAIGRSLGTLQTKNWRSKPTKSSYRLSFSCVVAFVLGGWFGGGRLYLVHLKQIEGVGICCVESVDLHPDFDLIKCSRGGIDH